MIKALSFQSVSIVMTLHLKRYHQGDPKQLSKRQLKSHNHHRKQLRLIKNHHLS